MTVPREMQAMVLERAGTPLRAAELPVPEPGPARSSSRSPPAACAAPICISSTASWRSPSCRSCSAMRSSATWRRSGRASQGFAVGDRVGVPWLGLDRRHLPLLPQRIRKISATTPRFTGYQIDGGYADYTVADARYCLHLPEATATPKRRRCSAPG